MPFLKRIAFLFRAFVERLADADSALRIFGGNDDVHP